MMPRALVAAVAVAIAAAGPAAAAFTDDAANRSSDATTAAVFAPRAVAAPAIVGATREGETLGVSADGWRRQPDRFAYVWSLCDAAGAGCAPIDGATAATYRPTAADLGATLRVHVTATNAGGSSAATSAAVGPVRRSYASEVAADSPSTYLRLDGSGATAYGSTGSAAPGALAGNATNRAATFTPASAVGLSAGAVNGAGTIELWLKGATGVLVGTQNATPFSAASGYAPLLYVDTAGVLRAGMFDASAGARVISSGTRVDDGAWHHAALTRSGATLRLFLDGRQTGAVTATGPWSVQTSATLGSGVAESAWWPGTGASQPHWQHYTGQIDEFATYPAVLTQSRLQAHIDAAR